MELNHLKYFYEVARAGSFTEAARKMRISQPSISKLVKQLEDQHNVKFFDRRKRGVTLTEVGRIVFASCENIFSEVEALGASLSTQKDEYAGDLSIGASDNLCNYILPDMFLKFCEVYPNIVVKLLSGTAQHITNELYNDQLELGLFYTPVMDKRSFEFKKLREVEFVAICCSTNKIMREQNFSSKALVKLNYIGSRRSDYTKPYPSLEMLRANGIEPRISFETNNQETQKKMVMANFGYSVVPRHMVVDDIKSGRLKIVALPKKLTANIYLVWRRNRSLSNRAIMFKKFLCSIEE